MTNSLHVTLVRPPAISRKGEAITLVTTPPIGLAYIAGAIKHSGYIVDAVDAVGEGVNEVHEVDAELNAHGISFNDTVNRISENTDVIGISCNYTSEWYQYRDLIQKIRQKHQNAIIICGGEHITAEPIFSMTDCLDIDYCVLGEGEETIITLLDAIETKKDTRGVEGIAYRSDDNILISERRNRIKGINDVAPPYWDIFPLDEYLDNEKSFGVNRGRSVPIIASRGCPYRCTFCSSPNMWTTRWLSRSTEDVISEMKGYIENYRVSNFDFYDLTAIVKRAWIIEFCNLIILNKMEVTWQLPSGTRSEAIDDEVCSLLYRSGCRNISYSPESGSKTVLKRIKKKISLVKLTESIRSALGAGLNVKANIILGFPEESHREVLESLLYAVKLSLVGVHDLAFWSYAPYPGSELFDKLKKEKKVIDFNKDYLDSLVYSKLTQSKSWNDKMSARWINFYRIFGMIVFYSINYIRRPMRLVRLIKSIRGYNSQHESRMELVLSEYFNRNKGNDK